MKARPIILIGPMSAGKSTVAAALAKRMSIPRIPMDRVRWYYYFKDGFSLEQELSIPSFTDVMAYWKPFEVKAVKRIISEFPEAIIDFGAGHSYFTEESQFQEVKEALRPIENIFLLLPCADKEESLRICNERLRGKVKRDLDQTEIEANRNFIEHPSNFALAKHVIYTKDKSPEEVAQDIESRVRTQPPK